MNYNKTTPRQGRSGYEMPAEGRGAAPGGCGCSTCETESRRFRFGVKDGVLAAVYTPIQNFENLYDPETALARGTLFAALDKPFSGGKECGCRG